MPHMACVCVRGHVGRTGVRPTTFLAAGRSLHAIASWALKVRACDTLELLRPDRSRTAYDLTEGLILNAVVERMDSGR